MKQARGLFLTVFLTLILLAGVLPANAAPEGQMTWAVHVSLAPTWFDPAETSGIITPFLRRGPHRRDRIPICRGEVRTVSRSRG
jgi:hypothetical protein